MQVKKTSSTSVHSECIEQANMLSRNIPTLCSQIIRQQVLTRGSFQCCIQMSFASYKLKAQASEAPWSDTAHDSNCGTVGSIGPRTMLRKGTIWQVCLLVRIISSGSHNVDVVHKFNNAIILHLKLWDNIYTFLIIIVGLQVGRTAVLTILQRIHR